jgi:hypothetical protein
LGRFERLGLFDWHCLIGIVSKYYRADAKASRSARPIAQGGFPPWASFIFFYRSNKKYRKTAYLGRLFDAEIWMFCLVRRTSIDGNLQLKK